MMRSEVIHWLRNPERRYGDGVSLFMAVANSKIKAQYSGYFLSGEDSMRMGILRSRLEWLYPNIPKTMALPPEPAIREELRDDLEDAVREELRDDLEDDVRKELLDELKEAVKEPDEILRCRERLKEIRPLQASIHASIFPENIPSVRANLRSELLQLESERRNLWKKIDAYDSDKKEQHADELEDPSVRVVRLHKRAKQLRQNIRRGRSSPERMESYQQELLTIEKELNAKKI